MRLLSLVLATALLASGCVWVGLVSTDATGQVGSFPSEVLDASVDGRYVLFATDNPLDANDKNFVTDIYRKDVSTGAVVLVSVALGGDAGDAASPEGEMSDDGNVVVFSSFAGDLVANDTNGRGDVFARDLTGATTSRVSVDAAGGELADHSLDPAVSADGSTAAFSTDAPTVVGDTNNVADVFTTDIATLQVTLRSASMLGVIGDRASNFPSLNGDGTMVAFVSEATNLVAGDTNLERDVFVKEDSVGFIIRASVSSTGAEGDGPSFDPSLSESGLEVAFMTAATTLFAGDANGSSSDVVHHDLVTDVTRLVGYSPLGGQAALTTSPSISGSGTVVAFQISTAGPAAVFDLDIMTTASAEATVDGNGVGVGVGSLRLSGDGRWVAADTAQGLVPDDTNASVGDVYLWAWREPVLFSISPATIPAGQATNVTISGSGFEPGATVSHFGSRLGVSNVVWVDDSTIRATFTATPGGATAPLTVFVENPDGGPGVNAHSAGWCPCVSIS